MFHFKKAALAATIALLSSTAVFAQNVVFKAADVQPDGYPTVEAIKFMGEYLSEKTDGRLSIEVFHSKQLGDEADTIEQTRFGVIDINRVSLGPFNGLVPETKIPSLPYIFRGTDHMRTVVDGEIGDDILAAFEPHDLIGLAFYDSGSRSFYNSVRPIESIDDLEGLKFRVMQSDLFVDMVNSLGANATPLPYGEVYSSIQTGVIDGAENNPPSYDTSGHAEVAKYYTLDEHLIVPEVLVMSKTSYDALSAEDQALIHEAAKASVPVMRELWDAQVEASMAKVVEAGTQIITDIDKQPFMDAMVPVYDKYVDSDELKDLVARIQATQ